MKENLEKQEALTVETLREHLHYDLDTGVFTWLKSVGNRRKGSRAGYSMPLGYWSIICQGKAYYAHRLAHLWMTGEWPPNEMDHINHNPGDNRWSNIRAVTRSENRHNQRRQTRTKNITGVVGVTWDPDRNKYYVMLNGKFLGRYKTLDEAIRARTQAEETLW